MRILSNVGFPPRWTASSGRAGEAVRAAGYRDFAGALPGADVVLVDSNPRLLMRLAALFLARPGLRRPLLGSDVVLRRPQSLRAWLTLPAHRFLLARVDHFLRPFHDVTGYRKYFGIGRERSSFYCFKPNLRDHCDLGPNPDGDYVLCLGRSMRDFDGFFAAMEITGLPGAIPRPDLARLRANGSRFTRRLDRLPANVRLLDHNPDDHQSQVDLIMGAKLVTVPLLKSCLVATGTPYNAMLLGKCTLVTEGPATTGLFEDEVLTMPAESPAGMAAAIQRAWDDTGLRQTTAAKGHALAITLGGNRELKQRLLDLTVDWVETHPRGWGGERRAGYRPVPAAAAPPREAKSERSSISSR